MFGVAATSGRVERREVDHVSNWTRDYLQDAVLAVLGCSAPGLFIAVQNRFGREVKGDGHHGEVIGEGKSCHLFSIPVARTDR